MVHIKFKENSMPKGYEEKYKETGKYKIDD